MPVEAPDYRLLFHQTPGIFLVLTPDLVMVEATEARLRATATRREEIIGRHLFDVFPDNPDDPHATGVRNLRASLDRVLQTGEPDAMAVQKYDIRRPATAGGGFEERFWSPLNVPVLGADGRIQFLVHRVEDVTEFVRLKRAEQRQADVTAELRARNEKMEAEIFRRAQEIQAANEKLRRANDAMGALDRAKTQFFNNASHELRTPLMLILGPLEQALADRERLPAKTVEQIEIALRSALRMQKLVGGLLDFARIEAGRMQPELEATDVVALTRDIVEGFRPAIERAGLRLNTAYAAVPSLTIDPAMWEKIVLNLLSNAVKFTPSGEIAVSLAVRSGAAELVVVDTGSGIPPDEVERVFDRFYQVASRGGRSAEGTGIGLALVKELTQLMGGTVNVESEPKRGSRFTVALPLRDHAQSAPVGGEAPKPTLVDNYAAEAAAWNGHDEYDPSMAAAQADEMHFGRRLVLVIEDNADMRSHLSRLLSERFAVHSVASADAAWPAMERYHPDLIITDMMLPKVDGLDFVRQLRQHARWRTTPVLVLTARAEESASVAGFESGADDFVVKPFGARELIARAEAHLKLAQLRNEAAEKERGLREDAERERRRVEGIIAGVPDGFALLDPGFRLRYLNAREAELLQRPIEELLGTVVWDSLPAYARPLIEPHLRQAMEQKTQVVFEYQDRARELWFEKRAYAVEGGVAVFSADITQRKRAEKLAAAKYSITQTLSASPKLEDAVVGVLKHLRDAIDADLACFWLKRPGDELLELSYSEPGAVGSMKDFVETARAVQFPPGGTFPGRAWVGRKVTWSPDLESDPGFARRAAARGAGLVSGVAIPVAIDDEIVGVIELFLCRRFAPSEPVLKTLGAAGSEIGQFIRRRRAEAEQRKLTSIVHSSNDAIVALTVEGTITDCNRAAEILYGYSAPELIGEPMERVVPPERRAELREARERAARGERVEPVETVRVRKDGSRLDVSSALSPIFDEGNRLVGVSAISRDITTQKRAEAVERQNRELQDANRRAVEASEMKSEFLANMSHELRTPLHGIIGFSEFLVDEKVGPLNPTQKEFLNDVLNSAQHLLRLINNVLDISKVESGHLELFPESLVLGPLIQEVCTIVRPLADKHRVALRFAAETAEFDVMIDPLRLRQVLYNLVANAVQYNRPDGSVHIEVAHDGGSQFEIAIVDTGIGISTADQKVIFEEFRQLPTRNRPQGTGLGLAVTRRLVECMHGTIRMASQVGSGSRFTVTFPVLAPAGA